MESLLKRIDWLVAVLALKYPSRRILQSLSDYKYIFLKYYRDNFYLYYFSYKSRINRCKITNCYIHILSIDIINIHPNELIERVFFMKMNVRRIFCSYVTSYGSNPSVGGFLVPCWPKYKSIYVRDLIFLMLLSFN